MDNDNKELRAQTHDGGITEAQIEAFKGKHGKVYRVDIVDG